jgi:phosphatidylserine synthase
MVEALRDLNRICQKPNYKTVGNWMARHITRDMALPVTWLLLYTPLTANHVTVLAIGVILLAGGAFWAGSASSIAGGVILFQLWYLLDHVDGQIARARKSASVTGVFFDSVMHHIVNLTVLISLGAGSFRESGEEAYLIAGSMGAVSMTLFQALYDCKYRAYFQEIKRRLHAGNAVTLEPATRLGEKMGATASKQLSFPRRIYSGMHKLCEVHVFMNILTAAAFIQWALGSTEWVRFLVLFYAGLATLVFVVKLGHWVKTQEIDASLRGWLGEGPS